MWLRKWLPCSFLLAAALSSAPVFAQNVQRPVQYPCLNQEGTAASCQFTDVPQPDVTQPFTPPSAEKKAMVVATAPYSGTMGHASVSALGTSLLVKSLPGRLFGFNCTAITGGAAGYCVAYNSATVPSTGALTGANVLDVCFFAASAAGCSLSRIPNSAYYPTGIVILVTSATTPFTYTTGTDTAYISADFQ